MIFLMLLSGCQQQTTSSGVQSGYGPDSSLQNVFTAAIEVPVAVESILRRFHPLQETIQRILRNPALMQDIESAVRVGNVVSCFETRLIGSAKKVPGARGLSEEQYQSIRGAYLAVSRNKTLSVSASLLASSWSSFEANGLALTTDPGDSASRPLPGSVEVAALVPALALVGVMIVAGAVAVGCSAIADATSTDPRFLVTLIGFGSGICAVAAGIGTVVSFFASLGKLFDVP